MATFTTTDARHILEAAGERAPDLSRCRYAQQCFSDIASAYLRERPSPATFTAAIRVADKLSKVAALARSLRGTITFGDASLTKGVRDALARAGSQLPGRPREDLSEVLTSLNDLEACASRAYRELRESAKRAYRIDRRQDSALEKLLEGLERAWGALYGSPADTRLGAPYARFVKAYIEHLAAKEPNEEELRELTRKTVFEWKGARRQPAGGKVLETAPRERISSS
jgi:hypothetical protein